MKLTRTDYRADGIFGVLTTDGGEQLAVTLEHSYNNEPKIPKGIYTCIRYRSPHFGYDVFVIQNIAGHDYLELHRGNYNKDSNGCILLGEYISAEKEWMITNSKVTFKSFMARLSGIDTFTLEIV